jgi:RecJ-like exonuclease
VLARWIINSKLDYDERWARRIEQLSMAAAAAWNSYEISKQNQEETITNYLPRPCRACDDGKVAGTDDWCAVCGGTGSVVVENVTRKVKGQAGDSSFLREFRENVKDMIRLEGLYEIMMENIKGKENPPPPPPAQYNTFIQADKFFDVSKMSSETLLKAKMLLEDMRTVKASDDFIIDVGDDKQNIKEKP